MAVALSTPTVSGASTLPNFSHVVAAGTTALYVRLSFWDGGGGTVSGVTWNSVALTRVAQTALSNGGDRAEIWRLLSPTAATANVTATGAGAQIVGEYSAANASGSDTTTPEGTAATAASTVNGTGSGNLSVSAVTGDLVVCAATDGSGTAITPGATGATPTEEYDAATGGEQGEGFKVDGAATAVAISGFTSAGWALAAIPVKQAGGAAVAQRDPVTHRAYRAF